MQVTYSSNNSNLLPNNLPKALAVFFLSLGVMVLPVFIGLLLKYKFGIAIDNNSVKPIVIGIILYGLFVLLYLFPKAGSWATTIKADPNIPKLTLTEVVKRLYEINSLDVPFTVKEGKKENELIVQWKVADKKWLGLMFAGKLKFMYKLMIYFDEINHVAKVRERTTSVSWDASGPIPVLHMGFNFSFFQGINLLTYKSAAGMGIIWKDGKFVLDNTYKYTFTPNEVKYPVSELITKSGWDFVPVI